MKLFLVVVSVIAVFTADSRDIPGKPDQDERFHDQPLDRDLHMELNNGSWLVTVQPQGFNSSEANQLFIEEREGRNENNRQDPETKPTTTVTADDKLHYKDGVYYEMIWNDKGSGGWYDVSIWRIYLLTHGYCSLGDVAVSNYHNPVPTISVSVGPFATHPASFTKIWTDSGSGATLDGAVYRMNPMYGYTCLGGAAMRSHTTIPDRSRYCCIHNDYISYAGVHETYNDKGTGAYQDLSLWTVWNNSSDVVPGNNFIAVPFYHNPGYYQSYQAFVINKQKAKKVTG